MSADLQELLAASVALEEPAPASFIESAGWDQLAEAERRRTEPRLRVAASVSEHEDAEAYRVLAQMDMPLRPIPDLQQLRRQLDIAFPWFERITAYLLDDLAIRAQGAAPFFKLPPVLLLGDPGVGKSAYCSYVAELVGVPWRLLACAGRVDNKDLKGTARGWAGAHPGLPVELIAREGAANPLIVLDELEKASAETSNGRLWDALLNLLEPGTARQYYDECLGSAVDLSCISWIATANDVRQLPAPLLSRFRVMTVPRPSPSHYPAIIRRSRDQFAAAYGLDSRLTPSVGAAEQLLLRPYCTSPRRCRQAVEVLLKSLLTKPTGLAH